METLTVALVAGVLGPSVLAVLTWWLRRAEKREDWRRQDEVARLLVATDRKVSRKLDKIHVLVNSQMTLAKQSELDALLRELVSLREITEMKQAQGAEPSAETLAYIDQAMDKIEQLKKELAEREEAQEQADRMTSRTEEEL